MSCYKLVLDENYTDEWVEVLNLLHEKYQEQDYRRYQPDKGGYIPVYHLTKYKAEMQKTDYTGADLFMADSYNFKEMVEK